MSRRPHGSHAVTTAISSARRDITLGMYDPRAFERLVELYAESCHPFPGSAAAFTLTNLHHDLVDAVAEARTLEDVAAIVAHPWTVPLAPVGGCWDPAGPEPDLDCDG